MASEIPQAIQLEAPAGKPLNARPQPAPEAATKKHKREAGQKHKKVAKKHKKATPSATAPAPAIIVRSPEDRNAEGKALRDKVLRAHQGVWKASKTRTNPIDILRKSDPERLPELVPIRYGRMLQSPFAFYRGSAAVMAADLAQGPSTGLRVQACGDCHLMNFGGFATPERNMVFSINDFDETLPAPWEWDLKRLATSIVLAARSLGFADAKGRDLAVSSARSYRDHLRDLAGRDPLEVWYARITAEDVIDSVPRRVQKLVEKRIEKARERSGSEFDFPKLADTVSGQTRIRDQPPLIFHPEDVRALGGLDAVRVVMGAYRQTLADDRRALFDQYHLVDAAIKVVGIGSVGRRCWIVLMMSEANDPLFLQVKEAVPSVLEPFAGKTAYRHHGERVVVGQRLMQPASDIFLGWLTGPEGNQFYVRQLRDAKMKPMVESFDEDMLGYYSNLCGWELARSHAKGGEVFTISGYLGGSDEFDEAIGNFAVAYANQAERDHAALKAAVRTGKIKAFRET